MTQIIQLVDPKANTLRLFTPHQKKEKQKIKIDENAPYSRYRFNIFYTRKMLTPAQAKAIWDDDLYHELRDKYIYEYQKMKNAGGWPEQNLCVVNIKRAAIDRRDEILREKGLPPIF